ncbi:MAG: tetrahydrofolate dehydrogenase/cyclohydrolase catalytic domain-containing protein [Dehalococcoidia bacterium]|jgi:methylenetetrahydrofolate dehydrogenase (NADP+)/methenyltetrahydrofolate cyclohydrolase
MTADIISGTKIAADIRGELKVRVAGLKAKGIVPGLAMVRVGEDPASVSYVRGKSKASEELGIYSETIVLPEAATQKQLLAKIKELNRDKKFHGILVQLPLPRQIDEDEVISAIDPKKDVDGFHPENAGRLLIGEPYFVPCTPLGIKELLVRSGNKPDGKHVVICGRSNLVGKPMMAILIQKKQNANATVTMVHTGTKNMASITRQADILIAAMGKPKAITADMVKEGAVVIDVGVNEVGVSNSGKRILVGDVDFEKIREKAKAITPVPGGVGPMTVTMLMANTIRAAEMQA